MLEKWLSIEWWRGMFTRHGQKFGWFLVVLFGIPLVIGFGWSQYNGGGRSGANGGATEVIALVNGQPITRAEYASLAGRENSTQPGEQFAQTQGQILNQLIEQAVIEQEAKRQGITASDADVDREIQQIRDRVLPKGASDSDWSSYVEETRGMSADEFRAMVASQLVGPALLQKYKSDQTVTDQDVKNSTAEVKLDVVLVPALAASPPMPNRPGAPSPLPDALAQKKADSLLAQAKGGGNIAAIARANSADFTARQGGDTGWRPEYKSQMPGGSPMGVLGYGKDFDDAVHAVSTGSYTPVVKASGFQKGYVFAKVAARRNTPPKDFNAKSVQDQMRTERAEKQLSDLLQADVKKATIDFKNADMKAYYDYAKAQQTEQQKMMAQFGQGDAATAPTQAEVDKQQALADSEIAAMQKRNPDDATAAILDAENVKRQMNAASTSPSEREKLRGQVIALYEDALKTTEDKNIRFELADLYRDEKKPDQADKQYAMVARLLNADQPYDLQTMQDDRSSAERLLAGFNSIDKPQEAAKEKKVIVDLSAQIDQQQKSAAAAQKASAAAAPPLTVPPGGTITAGKTLTIPSPPNPSAPAAKESTAGAPPPTGAAKPATGSTPSSSQGTSSKP